MRAVIESELRNRDLDNSTDGSNEGRSLLVSLTIPVIFPPYMKFEIKETAPPRLCGTLGSNIWLKMTLEAYFECNTVKCDSKIERYKYIYLYICLHMENGKSIVRSHHCLGYIKISPPSPKKFRHHLLLLFENNLN